ncbi:MAG: aldehyde ferredoxin oxidoreductase, partial [Deltaproteobacteria bacterium]|nr:aldehyde ferredoxin oxidoreductase [Deltaproteobacteria bacterium]
MAKLYGWTGKILRVNLSDGSCSESATMDYAERFIGGRGIALKLYWDEVAGDLDPFDSDSPLIMMTGPLCGSGAIGGSRWIVAGKSPLMHPAQFGIGNIGGSMGVSIKAAGYDGIVITGAAAQPACLVVDSGGVAVEAAEDLWGLETDETLRRLSTQYDKRSGSLCIGPAGENRLRFAVAVSDRGATGGSGFGAVLGSKKLKAIVVRGDGRVAVARPHQLRA